MILVDMPGLKMPDGSIFDWGQILLFLPSHQYTMIPIL